MKNSKIYINGEYIGKTDVEVTMERTDTTQSLFERLNQSVKQLFFSFLCSLGLHEWLFVQREHGEKNSKTV